MTGQWQKSGYPDKAVSTTPGGGTIKIRPDFMG
jgi:hypothetical protein